MDLAFWLAIAAAILCAAVAIYGESKKDKNRISPLTGKVLPE